MNNKAYGRLYQSQSFRVSELEGFLVEQVLVAEHPESNTPFMLCIKIEQGDWYLLFLDAGIGFAERWKELDGEDKTGVYKDKTHEFGLYRKVVTEVRCEADTRNSRIVVELQNAGKLILQTLEPDILDSECVLQRIVR